MMKVFWKRVVVRRGGGMSDGELRGRLTVDGGNRLLGGLRELIGRNEDLLLEAALDSGLPADERLAKLEGIKAMRAVLEEIEKYVE